MEHLFNCHGEWNALLACIEAIPYIGIWLTVFCAKLKKKGCEHGHV